MNGTQKVKQAVSNYLKDNDYRILDLFYKMPCNSCSTVEDWGLKFSFFPDILLNYENKYYFCFVLNNKNKIQDAKNYIEKYSFLENFKIFLVENKKLFEVEKEKFILKCENLEFQETFFEKKQKTFKSQIGKWEENRKFGKLGEDKLIEYFDKTKTQYMELNFNAPCDSCSDPEDWKKFNKLPDGILKENKNYYFFDSKAKSSRNYIGKINFRDYKEYLKIKQLLNIDVKIFFLLFDYNKKLKEIFLSNINVGNIDVPKAWDGNKLIDLSNNLTQLY